MKCTVCGHTGFSNKFINKIFDLGDRHVMVQQIPAQACERCGEGVIASDTVEKIRWLVHGGNPSGMMSVEVFSFG
ncbi:MAG TPA: YgiT-type zinc finger domain-containing protein [Fibrobacteres bacterium]|nr:YgiT-type zinc finger domain-containing protein [Fibrobacterota bacterium]